MTRGTTNPNRLRRMDRWIAHVADAGLRAAQRPLVVDLGFGAAAVTTLELHERLARRGLADLQVLGLEIEPDRVAAAAPLARPGVRFALGGFEIPLGSDERPVVIRAANVLRQYPVADVPEAWALMAGRLAPGGLLVEGTCDELGRLGSWVTIHAPDRAAPQRPAGPARAASVAPRWLTLGLAPGQLARPSQLAARLPKALIHRNEPGEPVHALLAELDRQWARAAPQVVFGPRQRWVATAQGLKEAGWPVRDGAARWRLGELTVPWSTVAPG